MIFYIGEAKEFMKQRNFNFQEIIQAQSSTTPAAMGRNFLENKTNKFSGRDDAYLLSHSMDIHQRCTFHLLVIFFLQSGPHKISDRFCE